MQTDTYCYANANVLLNNPLIVQKNEKSMGQFIYYACMQSAVRTHWPGNFPNDEEELYLSVN